MKSRTKNLLLSIGCSIPLVLSGGDYNLLAQETDKIRNNKTIEEVLGVPESVKRFKESLSDSPLNDKPVLVRLSRNVDTYVVTSKNGYHIKILANRFDIKLIKSNREYSDDDVGFYSEDSYILKRVAEKLDKNKDNVISVDELSWF